MIYQGIIIDSKAFESNMNDQMVAVGYGAFVPLSWFVEERVPVCKRPDGWIAYMINLLSWPGQKLAEKMVCKVC